MKKLLLTPILLLAFYSCSQEEETQAPINIVQYTLTVTAGDGGNVTGGGTFANGTEVVITASPLEGYIFTGWEGNSSTSESLTVTLDSNQTYEALFQEEHIYEYNQLDLNEPPFGGTIFITGEIITSSDPSLFDKIEYDGVFLRNIYDRRLEETSQGAVRQLEVYVYTNYYSDGTTIETVVNPEFTLEESRIETKKMAFLIGQLPYALRRDIKKVDVNKGLNPWGGGGGGIIIHTEQTAQYEINEYWDGIGYNSNYVADISQETLIHEAAHTSLDNRYYPDRLTDGEKWIEAVALDGGCYISDYARDFPLREDIAELFLLYIAVRYFPERISDDLRDKILSCAYNRIKYFDSLGLDMSPYKN